MKEEGKVERERERRGVKGSGKKIANGGWKRKAKTSEGRREKKGGADEANRRCEKIRTRGRKGGIWRWNARSEREAECKGSLGKYIENAERMR